MGEKGQSAAQKSKQPLLWSSLLVQLPTQSMKEHLEREKNNPCLSQSHISLLYNTECGFGSSWRTCPESSRCIASGDGTCAVWWHLVEQAGSVPLNSNLELSGIFLCLFIPWIYFKRQTLYLVTAARVFRPRLHQQLIQTGLIFSAPLWSKFLSSSLM